MYQPMLFLHWKQVRLGLIPFMLAAFGLPLLVVQGLGSPGAVGQAGAATGTVMAYRLLASYDFWTPFFPGLATGIGMILALTAWNWDHQLKHVYALSLPVPRWQYALLKMGAGAAIATLPAIALWAGALLASASVTLPSGLHAYPTALTLRFLAATLLAYSAFFAAAAGTVRTTLWIVSIVTAFVLFGNLIPDILATVGFESFARVDLVGTVWDAMASLPGPFEVFTGKWLLIDV
jgi:hypothetical protein